jgi:predicted secreted protein
MTWMSAVLVYVVLWWVIFFVTLPIGVRSPDEMGEEVLPGNAPSAPVRPRLWLKAGVTTLVAAILWGVAYYLIESNLVGFRGL